MHYRFIIAGILSASILSGCGFMKGKDEAEKQAIEFLDDRIAAGGAGADKYYSPEFWKATSKEDWETVRNLLKKTNGDLTSYNLNTWNINKQAYTGQLSGTFVVLTYDTTYETGAGREKLTLHREKNTNNFKILGHHINTPEIIALRKKAIQEAAKQSDND